MNSYHSYFFIAGKIDDLHFHTNCQCLSSNLFLPGNELLRPIEVVEEAALFSEDGNADCFDPLDALAEIAQDIDVDVHGTNLDPNPDLGVQFLQDLLEDGSIIEYPIFERRIFMGALGNETTRIFDWIQV